LPVSLESLSGDDSPLRVSDRLIHDGEFGESSTDFLHHEEFEETPDKPALGPIAQSGILIVGAKPTQIAFWCRQVGEERLEWGRPPLTNDSVSITSMRFKLHNLAF
jgi:hypothetical protein